MTKPIVAAEECVALGAATRTLESFPGRDVTLGALHVSRVLPIREKRMIGPWCFLDRFGPLTFADDTPMNVAPHPHIGLQTVTWLFDGEVLHDDSLGSAGIDRVPVVEQQAGVVQVFSGSLAGERSPAPHFSDLVGADVRVHPNHDLEIGVDRGFEHGVLLVDGDCAIDGESLEPRRLYYLGTHRDSVRFSSQRGGRLLFVGGPPFPEAILMWWNFVARTPEEIADARADWEAGRRFGPVTAYKGPRLNAPELAKLARPNPMS